MQKIDDADLETKILELYEQNLDTRSIGEKLDKSTSYIDRILKGRGVYQFKTSEENKVDNRDFIAKPGMKFVVIHKETKTQFNDFKNASGVLTKYLKNNFPSIEILSKYEQNDFWYKTGTYWHENFFDILEVVDEYYHKQKKQCKFCNWETLDFNNRTGAYLVHLTRKHHKTIDEYVTEFPEEENYFPAYFEEKKATEDLLSDEQNYIACMICDEKMKRITNSHLKRHNMSLMDYNIRFSGGTCSENTLDIMREIYNKGLRQYENKFNHISSGHKQIADYIRELGFRVKDNDKKKLRGVELDILILDTNIAIEYNGLYYHSEQFGCDKFHHLTRTEMANAVDIKLIQIFEDEWVHKPEIVKSYLKNTLRVQQDNAINSEQYRIIEISEQEKEKFLIENHIFGDDNSMAYVGAKYNDEIVAVMTFNVVDLTNAELVRFATKLNCCVHGIAKVLLNYFISNYNPSIITGLADRRWVANENDNLYISLGFKLTQTIVPDYTYYYGSAVARVTRQDKSLYTKQTLKEMNSEFYDENKTEDEILKKMGFYKVWDCGKFRYELKCIISTNI